MATADGTVLPKPGIPKTLGILNVIFGVLLILVGLCTIGSLAVAPAIMEGAEKIGKEAQAKVEAQQKADLKKYDDRIAEAKTDEEKKQIEDDKAKAVSNQPNIKIDLSMATDTFKNRTIMTVSYLGGLSGLVLHIILLVSGIGLIRLTSWGRTLALWWGGLQIVQVLALMVATIVYVVPVQQANTEKMVANIEEQAKAKGGGGPVDASAVNMTKAMTAMQVPLAVGQSLTGCIYPIVLIILLCTPGARAACLPRKPMSVDEI